MWNDIYPPEYDGPADDGEPECDCDPDDCACDNDWVSADVEDGLVEPSGARWW